MITLRAAGPGDAARLLAWRNDPATRAASFSPDPVAPADHAAWLARRLADPATTLLIALQDGAPVGQVRVDADGTVSIGLAPEARGRGLATPVLRALAAHVDVPVLRAEVKPGNEPSLRAFARAGFVEVARTAEMVTLEWAGA